MAHVEYSTLKNFVSSAAEAECGGIFHNCSTAIGIRNTLINMGHPQAKTEVIPTILQPTVLCTRKCKSDAQKVGI